MKRRDFIKAGTMSAAAIGLSSTLKGATLSFGKKIVRSKIVPIYYLYLQISNVQML